MTKHFFFYLALSFILLHEMDAVRCKEWRIFPGLSLLNEKTGFIVFMLTHIPLFFLLIWGLFTLQEPESLIKGLNIFFIIHLGLHLLFLKHKNNLFKDWLSWTIIIGMAVFGLLDLLAVL